MINIYDNGAIMIGNLEDIINYVENDETLDIADYNDFISELKALRGIAYIVMVNYENPMGYDITYWRKSDAIMEVI